MDIIEAQASRSFTLKVAKADYKGEERYRPNEDIMVHASLKASLAPEEDVLVARRSLQAMVEEDVRLGVDAARKDARARLEEALNPQRMDPLPLRPTPAALPPTDAAPTFITPHDAVDRDTRHNLRVVAMHLQELTNEPVNAEVPKTQAQADKLLTDLKASIRDIEARRAQPPAKPAATRGAPSAAVYAPGAVTPAGLRICSNTKAHGRQPLGIASNVWDFSIDRYGKPLCRDCQTAATPMPRRA